MGYTTKRWDYELTPAYNKRGAHCNRLSAYNCSSRLAAFTRWGRCSTLVGISPIPAKGRTLFTPKWRPSHGVARPVVYCMNINLSCTACVWPPTTNIANISRARRRRWRPGCQWWLFGREQRCARLPCTVRAAHERSSFKPRRKALRCRCCGRVYILVAVPVDTG